jgi:hypothetical protein
LATAGKFIEVEAHEIKGHEAGMDRKQVGQFRETEDLEAGRR